MCVYVFLYLWNKFTVGSIFTEEINVRTFVINCFAAILFVKYHSTVHINDGCFDPISLWMNFQLQHFSFSTENMLKFWCERKEEEKKTFTRRIILISFLRSFSTSTIFLMKRLFIGISGSIFFSFSVYYLHEMMWKHSCAKKNRIGSLIMPFTLCISTQTADIFICFPAFANYLLKGIY